MTGGKSRDDFGNFANAWLTRVDGSRFPITFCVTHERHAARDRKSGERTDDSFVRVSATPNHYAPFFPFVLDPRQRCVCKSRVLANITSVIIFANITVITITRGNFGKKRNYVFSRSLTARRSRSWQSRRWESKEL